MATARDSRFLFLSRLAKTVIAIHEGHVAAILFLCVGNVYGEVTRKMTECAYFAYRHDRLLSLFSFIVILKYWQKCFENKFAARTNEKSPADVQCYTFARVQTSP